MPYDLSAPCTRVRGGLLLCSLSPEASQWRGQVPLLPQESDFTDLGSVCNVLQNIFSIAFLLTWKSRIFILSRIFFHTLTIQKDGQCQTSLLQFCDIAQLKRLSFSLPLLFGHSFITISLKTKVA